MRAQNAPPPLFQPLGNRKQSRMKYRILLIAIILSGCSQESEPPAVYQSSKYEAHCKEPLPVFTLGEKSNPTRAQESMLCSCIWKNLKGWEREVSQKLSEGKQSEISEMHMRAFPPRFGRAIEKCDGMNF